MRTLLVVTIVAGYALGTFPTAALVARSHGIADLRSVGDGNPGFWNAMELLGPLAALPILAGDIAKGVVAAGAGAALSDRWWAPFATGGAAMLGHAFPVWSRGRGGRSVATFVGVATVVAPLAAGLTVAAVVAPAWAFGRRFDVAVRAGFAAFPVLQLVIDDAAPTAATGALMSLIGVRFVQAAVNGRRRRPSAGHAT